MSETNTTLSRSSRNISLLNYIGTELLHVAQYFNEIVTLFSKELPILLNIVIHNNISENFDYEKHVLTCFVLSKIVQKRGDLARYKKSDKTIMFL